MNNIGGLFIAGAIVVGIGFIAFVCLMFNDKIVKKREADKVKEEEEKELEQERLEEEMYQNQ
jgi:predicted membrane protein